MNPDSVSAQIPDIADGVRNHPWKHLGACEGVLKFTRASSVRSLARSTSSVTTFLSSPHNTALSTTPSSSSCQTQLLNGCDKDEGDHHEDDSADSSLRAEEGREDAHFVAEVTKQR